MPAAEKLKANIPTAIDKYGFASRGGKVDFTPMAMVASAPITKIKIVIQACFPAVIFKLLAKNKLVLAQRSYH